MGARETPDTLGLFACEHLAEHEDLEQVGARRGALDRRSRLSGNGHGVVRKIIDSGRQGTSKIHHGVSGVNGDDRRSMTISANSAISVVNRPVACPAFESCLILPIWSSSLPSCGRWPSRS